MHWGELILRALDCIVTVSFGYCVFTVVVLTCSVMCGCFGSMCACIYCVLYCLYSVFVYCFVYVYLFLFVSSVLV